MTRFAVLQSCTTCTTRTSASTRRRFAYPRTLGLPGEWADAEAMLCRETYSGDTHRFDVAELHDDGSLDCPLCGTRIRPSTLGCERCHDEYARSCV